MIRAILTGMPSLDIGQRDVRPTASKGTALLYYLAYRGGWVRREEIMVLLYTDQDERSARAGLRPLLSRLRRLPHAHALEVEPTRLRWSVPTDVQAFWAELEEGRPERAVEHVRGELLSSFWLRDAPGFEAWLELERGELTRAWRRAAQELVEVLSADGRHGDAAQLLARMQRSEPLDEEVLRHRLTSLARAGRAAEAANALEGFRARLEHETGCAPEPVTLELAARIRAGELPPEIPLRRARPGPSALRTTLPTTVTAFVGRERELAEVSALLESPEERLVTLVGPGGIGKTRLALEAARRAAARFRDGAAFVPMAGVRDAEGALHALAAALEVTFFGPRTEREQLLGHLRDRNVLLVLDDLDALRDGAELLGRVLADAPALTILVTSRERLGLHAETRYEVRGLSLPDGVGPEAAEADALRLLERAGRRARPSFRLAEDLPSALRICRQVDGMPLALELAASWLRVLSTAEVADQLEAGLDLLASATHDVPERHRSVRVAFEHSWTLLADDDQRALRALSVFRGGFRWEAAAAVADLSLPQLASLVDRSLVSSHGAGRHDLHPLMRQFLAEKAGAWRDAWEQVHARHGAYFLGLLARHRDSFPHRDAGAAATEIEADLPNVLAAWRWAAENQRDDLLEDAVYPLGWFFSVRGRHRQGLAWSEIPTGSDPDSLLSLRRLIWQGGFLNDLGAPDMALERVSRAGRLARQLDARKDQACLLRLTGLAHLRHDPPDETAAADAFRHSRALYVELGDVEGATLMSNNLAYRVRRLSESLEMLHEGLRLARDAGETHALGALCASLTTLLLHGRGDLTAAHRAAEESIAHHEAAGFTLKTAIALLLLGQVHVARGDASAVEEVAGRALGLVETFDPRAARTVEGGASVLLGDAACLRGEPERSAEHYEHARLRPPGSAKSETAVWAIAAGTNGLARLARLQGAHTTMRAHAEEALGFLSHYDLGGSFFLPASVRISCLTRLVAARPGAGPRGYGYSAGGYTLALAHARERTPALLEALLAVAALRRLQGAEAEARAYFALVAEHAASAAEVAARARDALGSGRDGGRAQRLELEEVVTTMYAPRGA